MKTKPTIKPKRKAKSVEEAIDEAMTENAVDLSKSTDTDLLNTLSKNTQDVEQKEKVYCVNCKHCQFTDCDHPDCFELVKSPYAPRYERRVNLYDRNRHNDCPDFEAKPQKEPEVETVTIDIPKTDRLPNRQGGEVYAPARPYLGEPRSLWKQIKDYFTKPMKFPF